MAAEYKRRWVLDELEDGVERERWRLSCPATGEIREANNPEALVDAILTDIRQRHGVVVLAEWFAARFDRGRAVMAATGSLTEAQKALAAAFAAAKHAAQAAKPGDDGGTANLDCVFLSARRGLTAATVRKAAEVAGVAISARWQSRWWNGWLVFISEGQGARNTRMAEAACRALRNAGYDASVYYQID